MDECVTCGLQILQYRFMSENHPKCNLIRLTGLADQIYNVSILHDKYVKTSDHLHFHFSQPIYCKSMKNKWGNMYDIGNINDGVWSEYSRPGS